MSSKSARRRNRRILHQRMKQLCILFERKPMPGHQLVEDSRYARQMLQAEFTRMRELPDLSEFAEG